MYALICGLRHEFNFKLGYFGEGGTGPDGLKRLCILSDEAEMKRLHALWF